MKNIVIMKKSAIMPQIHQKFPFFRPLMLNLC